jgi:hypothetical protein
MSLDQTPLTVLTVQTGHRYPDLWVGRLAAMVARHLPEAHRFVIYTDRPQAGRFEPPGAAHQQLEVRDLQGGRLKGFFGKLRLFDQALTGPDPFLFLDTTLVIRSSLAPLITIGRASSVSVTGVRDWNYPILNSSVLWCRPDAHTQSVWESWKQGRYAGIAFPSDQNFIFHVFRERAPAALSYWPEGLVCSYKRLRKLAAHDPLAAQRQLENCTILKFHGRPKPEEVLHPWRHPRRTVLRHPLQPRLWGYLAEEIRSHWH